MSANTSDRPSSRVPGFYRLSLDQRHHELVQRLGFDPDERALLLGAVCAEGSGSHRRKRHRDLLAAAGAGAELPGQRSRLPGADVRGGALGDRRRVQCRPHGARGWRLQAEADEALMIARCSSTMCRITPLRCVPSWRAETS